MKEKKVLDWLLEEDQPSIRNRTLTELLGRPETDPEVREARGEIPVRGWAGDILARRDPAGWWFREKNFYSPKYVSTNWNLLALSDLGATRRIPEVRASCELWMERSPLKGGGVGGNSNGNGHLCYTGNMARALTRFGYGDDPRVRKAFEWLVSTSHPKGGWTCWNYGDGPAPGRNLDSWEALSAFAVYPRTKWTAAMTDCIDRGAQYYLEHELHRQGARYEPWYRFHWPVHYYYDLLVGLETLTALGYGNDPRMRFALEHLRKKRRPDGRWNLDAVHPDVEGSTARWFLEHPKDRPIPLSFELPAQPSKMITLRALLVLSRVET
ncbi:MAG: hypothetical protein M1144_03200 [Candidatus Thermoplasmatota archaeon]|nr:hypothetical protein [Candidatus Thermoplasmatota archaeon]